MDDAAPPDIVAHLAGNGFRYHHVGIIVRDLAAAAEHYRLLGFEPGHEEDVPAQGVRVLLLRTREEGQYLELFTPLGDGRLRDFLEKRGEGMHHLAFAVEDIAAALGQLRANGVRLVDDTPRAGAHGWTVAFLHPAGTHGVLIELVQER